MQPPVVTRELLDEIAGLSQKAGEAILQVYMGETIETTLKTDLSPLTLADRNSHELIADGLRRLTPEVPVISEESLLPDYEERKSWEWYWLIDPLDGTKEFIARAGEFSVNIALMHQALPVLGVVHAPALGMTYSGAHGLGAYKTCGGSATPIRCSDYRKSKLVVAVSRSHGGGQTEKFIRELGPAELLRMGSIIKLCLVAEGKAHLYPRLGPTMEWDIAAAHCILLEAGGSITDLEGSPLCYNKPDLKNPSFVACGHPPYPWKSCADLFTSSS